MTPEIEILHDAETIAERVASTGARIDRELREADPIILSLLGGSFLFTADLLRSLEHPFRYEFVHVRYTGESDAPAPQDIRFPIPVDVQAQNVLVVKDVVDSGITEAYLKDQLQDRGANEVSFAALVDMPSERKNEIEVDYPVFQEDRSGKLVGYGLKKRGRYGHLPYIGRLIEDKYEGIRDLVERFS